MRLTTSPPVIHVTTSSDSLQAYELKARPSTAASSSSNTTTYTLEPLFSDSIARETTTHFPLYIPPKYIPAHTSSPQTNGVVNEVVEANAQPNIVLIADKYGSVTGISHPTKKSHQNAAETFFEISLPQCVTRFKRGEIRPPWRRNQSIPGVIADDIIGSCTDGTVFAFAIVDNPTRILLKFLENLVTWEERVRLGRRGRGFFPLSLSSNPNPSNDAYYNDDTEEERSTDRFIIDPEWETTGQPQRKSSYAINADVLERFFEKDGVDTLRELLEHEDSGERSQNRGATGRWNGNSRQERARRFTEVLARALGVEESMEGDLDEACMKCVGWLREVLIGML
jgi:hypothetical protein